MGRVGTDGAAQFVRVNCKSFKAINLKGFKECTCSSCISGKSYNSEERAECSMG